MEERGLLLVKAKDFRFRRFFCLEPFAAFEPCNDGVFTTDGGISSASDSGISGSSSVTSSGKVEGSIKMRPLLVVCRSLSGAIDFDDELLGVSFSFCWSSSGTNNGDVCCGSMFGDADIVSPTS